MSIKSDWRNKRASQTNEDLLTKGLFAIYLMALNWILLFKLGVRFTYMDERRVNLIPFNELISSNGHAGLSEIIMNIVIFVPLGIYTGVLLKRWSFAGKIIFFFLMSLMFELLQFSFKIGAFDATDITTNLSGGIIGLLMYAIIKKIFSNSIRSQRFINIIATTGTLLMIIFLVMLKLNMLPLRYQ